MPHEYKFYIQQVQKNPDGSYTPIDSTTKDLEAYYQGLKYSKLEGVGIIGKAKNIYTEKYADGDNLRVYLPELVQNETTTLTLTLYFFGKNRQEVLTEFANEIKNGIHRYWDTARQYYFDFFVEDEIKPSDESWYKGEPYFKVDVKMNNIYGRCFSRTNENIVIDGEKRLNNDNYLLGKYDLRVSPNEGELVRLSFSGYLSETNTDLKIQGYDKFRVFNSEDIVPLVTTIDMRNYNREKLRFEIEFNWIVADSANDSILFYQSQEDNTALLDSELPEGYRKGQSLIYDVKLEIVKTKKI